MASFGGGSGGPGHSPGHGAGTGSMSSPHWRNGIGTGPSSPYGSGGGDGGNGAHSVENSSPSPHFHHRKEREAKNKTHETVVNMLSMLTLGVEESSYESHNHIGSSSSMSLSNRNEYGLSNTSSSADNQRMLLLNMANTPESCLTLRKAGCIPLLVELIHPPRGSEGMHPPEIIQVRAARALKNIVQFNPDEKEKKEELRVLRLLEGIRLFTEVVKGLLKKQKSDAEDQERSTEDKSTSSSLENIQHPTTSLAAILKMSYDSQHRCTMCLLGAIHALADLTVSDHLIHGNDPQTIKEDCFNLRRLTGRTLTNLTVYDKTNKTLLCGMKDFLMCLVKQLECENEEICNNAATVLRNLSHRVDSASMAALSDVSPCSKLMLAAMKAEKELMLKANLAAVWNLSGWSPQNMADICTASNDALPFLVSLMKLNNPIMKEMKNPITIVEYSSGILVNISQHIRLSPELKKVLRENHCYEILLEHLKSSSMLVVGNACGSLCSISAGPECEEDQRKLLDLNAIPMLKSLVYSKDQRISQGSSTALRNLLSSKFAKEYTPNLDSRLSEQIYTSPGRTSDRSFINMQHKSAGASESDHELDLENLRSSTPGSGANNHFNQHRVVPEPPVAHQQSTSSAASLFHARSCSAGQNPVTIQFHNHPPLPLPRSQPGPGGYRNRPSTINYYTDTEPLDLTITSSKSSPIHVISAEEFNNLPQHRHKLQRGSSAGQAKLFHQRSLSQSQSQPYRFYNTNPLSHGVVHHDEELDASRWQMGYSSSNFNRSCPEILSRIQNSAHIHDSKPLDYSASGSASSSCRGDAGGEDLAGESLNDCNGDGDTTFNYSLRFAEDDGDEDANDHQIEINTKSDDTVKTYCYEGTPQTFSKSNSCQDLVQELEFEREAASGCNDNSDSGFGKSSANNKLEPIDEVKPYYVENTPAAFSRASSLSSIHSSDEAINEESTKFVEENLESPGKKSDITSPITIQIPPQPIPRKRTSLPHTPCRVTFSADETPLMFSRCSSVASLDSLDVGMGTGGSGTGNRNDDDLSDYSRRASEVVSPSELPDSPRALAPPVRFLAKNNAIVFAANKEETEQTNCDADVVKIYSISMTEKSGLNSCRSLSPLTVDGEELQIIGKDKIGSTNHESCSINIHSTSANESGLTSDQIQQSAFTSAASTDNVPLTAVTSGEENTTEKNKRPVFPVDELKLFAVEGTPFYGVSNATSLSDLIVDIDDIGEVVDSNSNQLEESQRSADVQNAALALVNTDAQSQKISQKNENGESILGGTEEGESIYSDAQLLEKCIRVGKAMGIPKSQSEFRIGNNHPNPSIIDKTTENSDPKLSSSVHRENNTGKVTSKSQDFEFDDPDLAALIQIGRNRTKDKDKTSKSKGTKRSDKIKSHKDSGPTPRPRDLAVVSTPEKRDGEVEGQKTEQVVQIPNHQSVAVRENRPTLDKLNSRENRSTEECVSEDSPSNSNNNESNSSNTNSNCLLATQLLDPNQVSTMSLGSEWNDETPTFSSPIPSMSISTAFKLAESINVESLSMDKPPIPPKSRAVGEKQNMNESMNISCLSISTQNELLDNVEPPSTFSNLVSSTDCAGSPQIHPRSQTSISDKLNKKWKVLTDAANNSCHSNLTGQKPPMDFDMENSMISVASIKSEIYELSSESLHNEIFESAVEDFGGERIEHCKAVGDNSIGGNTYTIFPSENANRLSGVKSTDLSDGKNTVVSEDFTDAEDIEDYETAPMDDQNEDVITKPEKTDGEKIITTTDQLKISATTAKENNKPNISTVSQNSQSAKPLMEVRPLVGSNESNKYNTFVVKKSSMSPRASPRQKRRDDPERYRTHTINPVMGKAFVNDANGNPDLKFATFKVGGPKVIKSASQNINSDSDSTNSPSSTPGHSPIGIRGRRKPLYTSLPPSAIIRKQKTAPPPVPPKPVRTSTSPARSTTSLNPIGVYVRPTRTTELRNAANNSRDSSPRRLETTSSRNSSNSSLNLMQSSRMSDCGASVASGRPKTAPKPPVRTTPSITTGPSRDFSGLSSNIPIQIKASNSSFGFGQQSKSGDLTDTANIKGYSTLPKSSKFRPEIPFSMDRYNPGESKESIPGSEKSGKSGMGKISNLWKKMDFRSHKDPQINAIPNNSDDIKNKLQVFDKGKKSAPVKSKLQNFFGRGKKEKLATTTTGGIPTTTQQPFREPLPIHPDSACNNFSADNAPASTGGIRGLRREGDNKVIVPPFNYTPPDRSNSNSNSNNGNAKGTVVDANVINPSTVSHGVRSTKITTV